jgi:hypothetical protein
MVYKVHHARYGGVLHGACPGGLSLLIIATEFSIHNSKDSFYVTIYVIH